MNRPRSGSLSERRTGLLSERRLHRRSRFAVKDDRVYLQHIGDALEDIASYANAGRAAFFTDRTRQDATIRSPDDWPGRQEPLRHVEVTSTAHPVEQIAGLRDKVIHDYFGMNLHIVWAVVEKDLPTPRGAVDDLLNEP